MTISSPTTRPEIATEEPLNATQIGFCIMLAAERGSELRMMSYARTLFFGYGVDANNIEAWAWTSLVTEDEDQKAKAGITLVRIGEKMTPEQITEAKKRAKEIEKNYLLRNRHSANR